MSSAYKGQPEELGEMVAEDQQMCSEPKSSIINHQSSIINRDGFTLIEIIIFIVIVGIILPVILVPFTTSIKESLTPEKVAKATCLAQYKMEELTKNIYDNSNLDPIELTTYARVDPTDFPGYYWQWQISYVDEDFLNEDFITDREYKLILVKVKDTDGREIELQTVVTRRPADE